MNDAQTKTSKEASHPNSPVLRPRHYRPGAIPGFPGNPASEGSAEARDSRRIPQGFHAPNMPFTPDEVGSFEEKDSHVNLSKSNSNKTPEQWAEDLDSRFASEVHRAMAALNKVEPSNVSGDLKKRVARKAKELAFDERQFLGVRKEATKGLAVWGGKYSTPFLVELLGVSRQDIQREALKSLQDLHATEGAEAAAKIFAANGRNRDAAAEYLESVGPDAEPFVLEYVRPTTPDLTKTTVRLLGKIGTKKSFKAFKMLEKTSFYTLVRSDIEEAKKAIRKREKQ